MPFKKGQSGNPSGKPKGAKGKDKLEFQRHLNLLLEESAPKMKEWLEDIAARDPEKAFDILSKFAEFIHPKLSRQEQRFVDKDDNDILKPDEEAILERYNQKIIERSKKDD